MIAARSVTVEVDGTRLLDAVDVEVRPGEVVAVVGPNGAGKSTLLSILSGDRAPTSGSVTVDGHDLGSWSAVELGQRRAVLPQSTRLSFPFRVCEVVAMGRAPWRRTPDRARDAAEVARAMAETEVTALADRVHTTLSGGEQARVHLARVLVQCAPVLLLDEPTAALDLRHQQLVLGVARQRADAGAGVLAVLHDLGLAGAADRVVVLSAGRVVAHGAPTEVLRADLVEEVYRQPVHVVSHPTTGAPVVVPRPAT